MLAFLLVALVGARSAAAGAAAVSAPRNRATTARAARNAGGAQAAAAEAARPVPASPAAAPTEAMLGVPIYPGAQFIASYDAGRGQRYYIFGSAAPFVDLVTYYRTR